MKSSLKPGNALPFLSRQIGIVLFFALIALVALSLAAVALIRSVDTSTLIAGNLAFKQSATTSADAGVETAINWLITTNAANTSKSIITDSTHEFNQDAPTSGYYSGVHDDPADAAYLNLFSDTSWGTSVSASGGTDSSGNTIRYIIQRMCRTSSSPVQTADCLFSGAFTDNNAQNIKLPQEVCSGSGCPLAGQSPMIRITARVTGPKNTVSYIQAFVY